jgi:hypothetical protein
MTAHWFNVPQNARSASPPKKVSPIAEFQHSGQSQRNPDNPLHPATDFYRQSAELPVSKKKQKTARATT